MDPRRPRVVWAAHVAEGHHDHEHHRDRRQDDGQHAEQVREVLAENNRATRDRAREQIGDGLVLDFIRNQRRSIEHAERGHDEPEIENRDGGAEHRFAVDASAIDGEHGGAVDERESRHDREHDGRAGSQRHEQGSACPEHLAERELEDPPRRRKHWRPHCLTR